MYPLCKMHFCIVRICTSITVMLFIFYSFFVFTNNEGKDWMMVVVCGERETILKSKKN